MKKIISILTILSLAVIFVAPLVASAETAPTELNKCTMRHDLKDADVVVAANGSYSCPAGKECPWYTKGFRCPWGGTAADRACKFTEKNLTCGVCCTMDTIYTVTDWIFLGVVIIAGIMILIGAFNIVTAGGSPEKVNTGRQYIIFAAVGVIVALIAKLIPVIAQNILGLG